MCADRHAYGLADALKLLFKVICYSVKYHKMFDILKTSQLIDREFVTSAKKFANFNEFSEIKKIRKNSLKIR